MKPDRLTFQRACSSRPLHVACLNSLAAFLGLLVATHSAKAADLMDVWRAAQMHDLDFSAAMYSHRAGLSQEAEASALWHPTVQVTGTAGRMTSDTATEGAQFSAPGFPSTNGVAFNTSVNNGSVDRWALSARQPLINPDRLAQSRQLRLNVEASDVEWQIARQSLILRTAERYFDVVLAQESLLVLRRQARSVEKSLGEIKSRFQLGDAPITDTHEATARMEAIQAQILSAETDLQLRLAALADATGLPPENVTVMTPTGELPSSGKSLDEWLGEASQNNPELLTRQKAVAIAQQESARYGALSSFSLDLVGEVSHDNLTGSGDFGAAGNTSRNALLGVQLTIPLYTGGDRSARRDKSAALAEKALNELDRTRQQIALQTRSAWLGLTVGSSRVSALAASLKACEARLAATRLGHEVGDRTTLDVLNAENDAANARLSWMQARIAVMMDRLRLDALAGKLEEDQLQAINSGLRPAEPDSDMNINVYPAMRKESINR